MQNFHKAILSSTKNLKLTKLNAFPFRKPIVPKAIDAEQEKPRFGINFDTTWARSRSSIYLRRALFGYILKPIIELLAAPHIEGKETLSLLKGPVIIVANHSSHLDTPLLLSNLPSSIRNKTVVAAAADYFFDTRAKSVAFALILNAIPMERTKVNRSSAQKALELLSKGWSLIIYPEGTRTKDGWMQEFKGGAAYLSLKANVPVLPIYITGTRELLKKGSKKLVKGSTKLTVGKLIYPSQEDSLRDLSKKIELELATLFEESQSGYLVARLKKSRGQLPSLYGPNTSPWLRAWKLPQHGKERDTKAKMWPEI